MNFLINFVFGLFVLSTICYWVSLTIRIDASIIRWFTTGATRSEERRVGLECISRSSPYH